MESRPGSTTIIPIDEVETDLLHAVSATRGHFRYESGHHGDLWLDLDGLFVDARRARAWSSALAERAAACAPDFVCGPLTGGAFVAQWMAAEMGAGFVFAERSMDADGVARYRVPDTLRARLRGARVLLVDDAVNAGSALLGTLDDLRACGAEPAGFGSLLAMGDAAARIGGLHRVPFFTLASLGREMWIPAECPLCAAGTPLLDHVPRT
ncbi:MAG TPA: phosphoribosyltransferase family protein [Longimicrobium sp.]|nr:phosphoribosyltransferase family protein [Longimicrobium sp.]